MSQPYAGPSIREAVAYFDTAEKLQAAIDDLLSAGFDRADLSLLAGERTVDEKLPHSYRKVADLEDDETAPRTFYVAPETIGDAEGALVGALIYVGAVAAVGAVVASGGALAAAITAAAVAGGTGGLIGSVLATLVGRHHAHHLQQQLDRGGLLLWVRVRDEAHEQRATELLLRHAGHDVHVHAFPVGG